ncbi:MAG: hypothetical protein K6E94_01615, partial [Elusimicrobiaceae bacterium]|nr:hypothetical protein [Elusimicrobiaceae bacterium]
HNIYFRRNEEGKLIITIIDFENVNVPMEKDDRVGLDEIRLKLEIIGAKERSDENEYIDILDDIQPKPKLKLQNLLMPAIIGGLGLTMLLNGMPLPALTLASLPLLASTRPITNQTNGISAKVLFTDEYKKKDVKFFYKDVDRIINSLPSDFEGNDAIYRGMTLDKFEDLKRILIKGLQVNKSNYNYIYFSKEIETAIDYAAEYDYGHLPIIVKMRSDYYSKLGPVVKYSSDISASDIDEVIVWAELDGKLGWWRAQLNGKGEVVLQPTDNMQAITAPAVKPESTPKLLNYLMPAIGVGLGLTMLLNGSAEPGLALASLPFFIPFSIHNIGLFNNQKLLTLKTDTRLEGVQYGVHMLQDSNGNIKAYHKRVTQDEIDRTLFFDKIVKENNLQNKYSLIEFEYPTILSTNLYPLSWKIAKDLRRFNNKGEKNMIITPVNISESFGMGDTQEKSNEEKLIIAKNALKEKPITNAEWKEIVSLFQYFNKAGFQHTDLIWNLWFRRNDEGKLIITIIDFELKRSPDDMSLLKTLRYMLEDIGAKEKAIENTFPADNNNSSFNLPNWLLPTVGAGLGLTLMLNGMPLPALTLASLPLLASTRPIISQTDNSIPAQVLFTDEYKNKRIYMPLEDIKNIRDFLPLGFIEGKALYRGMALTNYDELKHILIDGLPGNKTVNGDGRVYFTDIIEMAVNYSIQHEFGHLPVLIKKYSEDIGPYISAYKDVEVKDITDVLVWASLDGKFGWWRAQLDGKGEVVLTPTDNMESIE